MEKELFLSGYCRNADQSRMVSVFVEDNAVTEVDCCYETCIYAPSCAIAEKIRQATEVC